MRIAVLDDYQQIAASYADWPSLNADVEFFADHLSTEDDLVERLRDFDIVAAMRERTPFQEPLFARLPGSRCWQPLECAMCLSTWPPPGGTA